MSTALVSLSLSLSEDVTQPLDDTFEFSDNSAGGMSISSDNFLRSLTKAINRVERIIASTRILESAAEQGSGLVVGIIDSLAGLTSSSSNAKPTVTGSNLGNMASRDLAVCLDILVQLKGIIANLRAGDIRPCLGEMLKSNEKF